MAMRWEDERYVRVYTRDTVEWEMLCWQARALMPLILRKVDRAGLLELGKHGARGLAASVKIPVDIVTAGLNGDNDQIGLIESGAVEIRGEMLVVPNFISAQETPSSDAQRKRDQREKDAALARMSQDVTESHDSSRGVTGGHSVPSVPSLPSRTQEIHTSAAAPLELVPAAPDPVFDFASVYAQYPRKEGKTKGIARLRSQVRTPEAFENLRRAVANFAVKHRAENTETQFIPHFSTWCSGGWRDYVDGPHIVDTKGNRAAGTRPVGHAKAGAKYDETQDATEKL